MKIQESGENYLETIYNLKKENAVVRSVDIVEFLNYSKSSVSRAVNILKQDGYIIIENGNINFTKKGLKRAEAIVERHNILTKFFKDLGVDKDIAEADACRVEHILSDETFDAIKKSLKK